ncbi:hypothetical protein VP1G_10008 [Cytospora mali]|uniref:Uncharacterized protein n=1 Tax=Cytospora mali TaxID=578113 RepID=A0A194VG88_CYTMA|nr:hypothetical protein VP1G_10008 [Valsa mali var. pyri (nom. inval.)]
MQTSQDDKAWQIQHMLRIYKGCEVSLVFPGGIQRLVSIDEPTAWIHRAWTLQEALAPPRVEVVYKWAHGSGMYYGLYRGDINELVPGESAITPLRELLGLNNFPAATFFPLRNGPTVPFRTTIFGHPTGPSSVDRSERLPEIFIFMLKSAFPYGHETFDERAPAIWRSALFRASSRPVDMVFSIMGLFGVTLDLRAFRPDDRLGATAALMRAILERPEGRASWLSIAPYLPPHPQLSTFPIFPRTSVEGQVELELDFAPETGYLCISRQTIRVHPLQGERANEGHHVHLDRATSEPPRCCVDIWAVNGTGWRFYDAIPCNSDAPQGTRLEPEAFAVLVGFHNEFSWTGLWEGPRFLSVMLIREHAPGRYHVESYFELSERLERWVKTWEKRELRIGGPSAIRAV